MKIRIKYKTNKIKKYKRHIRFITCGMYISFDLRHSKNVETIANNTAAIMTSKNTFKSQILLNSKGTEINNTTVVTSAAKPKEYATFLLNFEKTKNVTSNMITGHTIIMAIAS